jgi:hypothetical protein
MVGFDFVLLIGEGLSLDVPPASPNAGHANAIHVMAAPRHYDFAGSNCPMRRYGRVNPQLPRTEFRLRRVWQGEATSAHPQLTTQSCNWFGSKEHAKIRASLCRRRQGLLEDCCFVGTR